MFAPSADTRGGWAPPMAARRWRRFWARSVAVFATAPRTSPARRDRAPVGGAAPVGWCSTVGCGAPMPTARSANQEGRCRQRNRASRPGWRRVTHSRWTSSSRDSAGSSSQHRPGPCGGHAHPRFDLGLWLQGRSAREPRGRHPRLEPEDLRVDLPHRRDHPDRGRAFSCSCVPRSPAGSASWRPPSVA